MTATRKSNASQGLADHREQLNAMATALLSASGVDIARATQLQQALIGTFLFGMIMAYGMNNRLTREEHFVLAITVFRDSLLLTHKEAAVHVAECMKAFISEDSEAMRIVVRFGAEGQKQYEDGNFVGLGANMLSILNKCKRCN